MTTAAPLHLETLRNALGKMAARIDVDLVEVCESTNTLLIERARAGAPAGSVICASRQTAGRGRRGRAWQQPPGSLAFSVLWRLPGDVSGLPLLVGLALLRALPRPVQLKWPNDILLHGRKLAGILVESAGPQMYVIGIGINLGVPSVETQGGHASIDLTRESALSRVLVALIPLLDDFALHGFAPYREAWMEHDAFAGVAVQLSGENLLSGIARGVNDQGALLLETGAGTLPIFSGDVSLRLL